MPDHPLVNREDVDDEMFKAIGQFIYSFSQLELAIRLRLNDALKLTDELFEVIIGPYDFATLCNVTKEVLLRTRTDLDAEKIKKVFNRCHTLNQKARIVVAHGTWFPEGAGATHMSRSSFKSTSHFENLEDLKHQIDEAKHLMWHVVIATGWKYDTELLTQYAKIPPL
ncbi:hypothetical protein [Bradyrhizobium vignae]|uniref:hypothetical protein n=1 Tax=Bradyrhizobium vignae TaxID=1549949 RepID=UPI00100B70B9|nr:hypothetical protein [Bradyrhizobium vignae]RXG93244.1 hypothetical protein EAV90_26725 [Bradyrhizobium vignae]